MGQKSFYFCAALIMTAKSGAFSDAPPISPPSTLGIASSSAAFLAFIEPPYWIVMASAAAEGIKRSDNAPDYSADLVRLFAGGGSAGAYRPHRLISNYDIAKLLLGNAHKRYLRLERHDLAGYTLLALGKQLAHAEDDLKPRHPARRAHAYLPSRRSRRNTGGARCDRL